ncbi:hypothetical protein CAter282_3221 [Collimonas arenae]|uniref:Uncharacterized protein n=1 Tax=Collimonas arenae TaxID=279058 RepID=A0A127QLR9_9BURK|nr:hypothetical protein CAter282_3221 [Collimonas arenae]
MREIRIIHQTAAPTASSNPKNSIDCWIAVAAAGPSACGKLRFM